jgi:hypothetical protein
MFYISLYYLLKIGLREELPKDEDQGVAENLLDDGLKGLGFLAFGKSEELLDLRVLGTGFQD